MKFGPLDKPAPVANLSPAQALPPGRGASDDVVDRKRAEAALEESEARLRALTDHLPGGVVYQIVTDAEGSRRFSYFSRNLELLLGLSAEAVIADPALIYQAIHPEDRARVAASEAQAIAAAGRFDVQARFVRPDGGQVWCRLISAPRPLRDGITIWDGLLIDVSEAVRTEQALREERDRSAGVLQHMTDGFALLDGDFRILAMNAEGLRMDARPPEEIIGRTHWEVYPDATAVEQLLRQAMAARRPVTLEHCYSFEGARETWLEMRAFPLPGGQLAVFYRDISERREADRLLRESENRFRAAVDATRGILWTNNAVGEMLGEQPGWGALTGQSFEEYRGYGWTHAVHPDDAQPTLAAWQDSVAGGRTFIFEHRLRRHDGIWRRFSIRAVPVRDDRGEIVEWVGVHTDVTDQRAAEQALRESEAKFQAIADSIDQMVWSTRPDGFHDYYNQRWYEYTGVPQGSTDGEGWNEMFHPDDQPRAWAVWRNCLESGKPYHIEYRLRHHTGQYRWVLGRALPMRDEGGAVTRWFGTCTDIQEIVDARDTIARSRAALEQRVAERTAELEQAYDQLRQSQKLEAMGQLTGGVAHDFNNLLTPIVGGLDMLQRRGLGSEREQRLIAGALQSAERAKTLVQRLLAFARRQPLQPRAVDVAALIDGMADLVASTSGPQIKVAVDLAPELPPALADANQLEMAILNLSVNARDAMSDGGTLTISAAEVELGPERRPKLEPGRYVRLRVSDTGSGMDAETLARAVEPFFSTKGIGKGTGLGLSMVHGLASQLGGALLLSSRPGLGTCAELWLPASDADVRIADTSVAADDDARTGRVLLVDDEEIVRHSTAAMLSDLGYQVTEADSGEAALALIGDGTGFDLLVTDHLMPGMTGADLARFVVGRRPDLPVMIVSGYAEAEAIAPDLPRLVKPFRQDELAAKLAELRIG